MSDPHQPENETAPMTSADSEAERGEESLATPAQDDPLAVATREAATMRDRLLRTLAEMENLRKRTEREVADARAYGIAAFARDILDIADNMRRALDAVPKAAGADDGGMAALVEGVEITERGLLKALEKNGVRVFDPLGEKFNPNVHQAMYEVPDPSAAPGTITQVIQSGYMIGERVLRPAMVAVAKAPPKAPAKD